jgi:hypothetical protein
MLKRISASKVDAVSRIRLLNGLVAGALKCRSLG